MADDRDYVEVDCHPDRYLEAKAIAGLEILMRPVRTDDPAVITFPALAGPVAQDALRGLDCTIRIIKTAAEFQDHLARAYSRDDESPDRPV